MTHVEWQFGGWLREWPLWISAGAVAIAAVVGVIYVSWFYRRTIGELTLARRLLLVTLRAGVVLLLLLCLANPMRVPNDNPSPAPRGTVAVVVDRSASMSAPDPRGNTRLADALRRWKSHEADVDDNFSKVTYHRFDAELQPAANLETAVKAGQPGAETHLFAALLQTLKTGPAAIVCLTDGLDTTSSDASELVNDAVRRGVPIYFVPGENRILGGASLATVREIKVPAQILRHTEFSATVLIEIASAEAQQLPVELWSGETKLGAAQLPVRIGRNTLSWPVTLTAGEPGPMPLEFRIGDKLPQIAACTTEVVESIKMDVLYYQGALQWGYRFLRGALETDPSFRLTSILNPALKVQMELDSPGQSALADLPDDARALKRFQIIVLAHVFADRLTSKQQRALVEYARSGGGVLFISPDTSATARFSGTALEEMLPVVFAGRGTESGEALAAQQLRRQLTRISSQSGDSLFEGHSANGHEHIALKTFALPAGGQRSASSALFENGDAATLPKFVENAKVRAVKPGAEVLAVSGQGTVNPPDILLARQQFGSGFTAALTTDLLWRWKLSLPSDSRAVEKFWQQLLLSLAPGSGSGLRITKLTSSPTIHLPVQLQIDASTTEVAPLTEAVSPAGKRTRLILRETAGERAGAWKAVFTPTTPGNWEVRATNSLNHLARITFAVAEKKRSTEMLNLPADLPGMRQLAESTGGALLENTSAFPRPNHLADDFRVKQVEPLWNSGWWLGVLLGFYGIELILRRMFKLL
ncbi:MAG: vWA domain-containing protein [Verrucomicrobiota bacterium]